MEANNTTNVEESYGMQQEQIEFRIAKITLYVLIFVVGCVGNSLVAVVIVGAKDMRTPPNFLILNLALCDFLTPALSIPFDLALEESNYTWLFGNAMCKLLWPLQTAFSTSSSLTLAVISIERYTTLSRPFGRRITNRQVIKLVLTIHSLSMSLAVPYLLVLESDYLESSCDEVWPKVGFRQAYTIVLFLCGYALPLFTMSIAYMLIYRTLRSNLLQLTESTRPLNRRQRNLSDTSLSSKNMEQHRKEQNIRLAKMFIIVVVVFAISMFPNQVLWLWVDFGSGKDNVFFHYYSVVGRLSTYANSVLNPFIYALKSKEFRSGFAKIGRASFVHPLRKISYETRRITRKYSRSRPGFNRQTDCRVGGPVEVTSLTSFPVKSYSVEEAREQTQKSEDCQRSCKSENRISVSHFDTWLQEVVKSATFQCLLEEMQETVC